MPQDQPESSPVNSSDEKQQNAKNANNNSGIMCTKVLNVQNKRYYFDVKEHEYGRFLKLAETAQSGRKSRLVIPMYLVPEVEEIMNDMFAHLESLPEFRRASNEQEGSDHHHEDSRRRGGAGDSRRRNDRRNRNERPETEAAKDLKAAHIEKGRRKYYFNLKENTRGRYLRLKAIGDIPSTLGNRRRGGGNTRGGRGGRNFSNEQAVRAIIIPAAGVGQFRDELTAILKSYRVDAVTDQVAQGDKHIEQNGAANEKLPASQRFSSKSFRKVIFVDAGENGRGVYARISEIQGYNRDAVTIPSRHFKQLGEWFTEAAKITGDENPSEDEQPENNDHHHHQGSGDAKVSVGKPDDQAVPNGGNYDSDEGSDMAAPVGGNRRRQAASDDEE